MGGQVDSTTANVTENQLKLCLILFNAIFKTVLYIKFMNLKRTLLLAYCSIAINFVLKKSINQYRLININLSGHNDANVCMLPASLLILFSAYYY